MDFSLQGYVFCHDLVNPPTQSRSCDVGLKLTKSAGLINIERIETESAESVYLMTVPSVNDLDFTTSEQADLENDFTNLVLAVHCNNRLPKRTRFEYKKCHVFFCNMLAGRKAFRTPCWFQKRHSPCKTQGVSKYSFDRMVFAAKTLELVAQIS